MSRRWIKSLLTCCVILTAGALYWSNDVREDRVVRQLVRLELAADEELEALFDTLVEPGGASIELLTRAMAHERPAVARQAAYQLTLLVSRWETLPATVAQDHLGKLLAALHEQMPDYAQSQRTTAADLALRVLLWPNIAPSDREKLVNACERLLRAESVAGQMLMASAHDDSLGMTAPEMFDPDAADARATMLALPNMPLSAPGALATLPPLPPVELPATTSPNALLAAGGQEPQPLPDNTLESAAPLADAAAAANQSSPVTTASAEVALETPASLEAREVIELFRLWHEGASRQAVEAEFRRRGFSERQLQIGQGLTDPSPEVRRRGVEALPGLSGVDALPWLLWLSRDEVAEVRLTALQIMATSGEPGLLRRVGEMSRSDPDPQVRTSAESLHRRVQR